MLTKSDLLSASQCSRKLWLEKNRDDLVLDPDPGGERRKNEGIHVGELARAYVGENFIWPRSEATKEDSAIFSKALLEANPGVPAVEFPLFFNGLYARADALIPEDDGYVLQETKATTFPLKKDKVTPDSPEYEHLLDLSIQAYAMQQSGLLMTRAELNLLNSQWKYGGDGDYSGMFKTLDVTELVEGMVEYVPIMMARADFMLKGDMPKTETGKQCSTPHNCPYLGFCHEIDPPKPDHPIELLPDSAGKKLAQKLRSTHGYTSILQPALNELVGKSEDLYHRIQLAHRTGKAFLSKDSGAALAKLPYPRYFFDFEGIDMAVPVWKGVRPYEQIPFQWSCHIERSAGVFEHGEFLDLTGNDPSIGCAEQMLKVIDLDDNGPIFVYFATYERGRLMELAGRHPQYAEQMKMYASRLVDLLPMVKENFYHPLMRGSFSIKKVLPVIAPDLDYSQLTEVTDGVAAQLAYIRAALSTELTPEQKEETRRNASRYCRQDTWAMVEVAYFLAQSPRPVRHMVTSLSDPVHDIPTAAANYISPLTGSNATCAADEVYPLMLCTKDADGKLEHLALCDLGEDAANRDHFFEVLQRASNQAMVDFATVTFYRATKLADDRIELRDAEPVMVVQYGKCVSGTMSFCVDQQITDADMAI
jgi:hypothetical protein